MPENKNKDPKTIDHYFADLSKKTAKNIDEAFGHFDHYMNEDNQNHIFNNILTPAQDELYNNMKAELDTTFKDDKASTHNKHKELKKAAVKGLKKYFKKVRPGVLDAIEGIEDLEEQYEVLSHHYDMELGITREDNQKGLYSLRQLVELSAKDKDGNVGKLKKNMYLHKAQHAMKLQNHYMQKAASHHLGNFHAAQIGKYLKPKIEERGFEIKDKVGFGQHDIEDLIDIREGLKKGAWRKPLDAYHIKYKEKKPADKN